MRTVAAREMVGFRDELVSALGGDPELSPQRRKLVDLAARAALYVDHIDGWLAEQRTLINHRSRSVLPVLVQRQAIADHLARLLDKLGLDRIPRRVKSLGEYLAEKYTDTPTNGVTETASRANNSSTGAEPSVGPTASEKQPAFSISMDVSDEDRYSCEPNSSDPPTESILDTDDAEPHRCTRYGDVGVGASHECGETYRDSASDATGTGLMDFDVPSPSLEGPTPEKTGPFSGTGDCH